MSAETHDIKNEVKKYWLVFAALMILTVITVLVGKIEAGVTLGIIIALIIATIKGSLVGSVFMHLAHETKLIYYILIVSAIFFAVMMFLILGAYNSTPEGLIHVS